MFTIGKTYQIVLNTDLDGNTLPFPHTMVGTCLSFDKQYATFLDPMTNIVRGMKIQQGVPTAKDSACKGPTTPKPTAPSISKPTVPATKSILNMATPSLFKKSEPAKSEPAKTEPVKSEPEKSESFESDPNRYERPAVDPKAPDDKSILKKFKDHLASKEETFPPDLTEDLEAIKKKNKVPSGNFVYSFTGGSPNPIKLGSGTNTIGSIQSKYNKTEETCFFLFNTKQLIDKGSGFFFMVALPKSECDKYTQKKILFQSTDTTPVG